MATEVDEEHSQSQSEEVCAISVIYPQEFRLLSRSHPYSSAPDEEAVKGETVRNDDFSDCVFEHPIIYTVRIGSFARNLLDDHKPSEDSSTRSLANCVNLRIEYPASYPDVPPCLSLKCDDSDPPLQLASQMEVCLDIIKRAAEEELGMPCAMACVQAGRFFFEQLAVEEVGGGKQEKEESEVEVPTADLGLLDSVPRPVLNQILDLCSHIDHGRASIACSSLRSLLERRAERILRGKNDPIRTEGDAYGRSCWDEGPMVVNGELLQFWERDERRCAEDLRSYNEQLHRREKTTEFDFKVINERATWEWRVREGLTRVRLNELGESWSEGGYSFYHARSHMALSRGLHFFLVQVRMRKSIGVSDIYVGITRDAFDSNPSQFFDSEPGWGMGTESESCAFVNVMSGWSASEAREKHLGIAVDVDNNKIRCGIASDSFADVLINDGRTILSLLNGAAHPRSSVYLGVVGARQAVGSAEFHTSVILRGCSENEWNKKITVPQEYE